MKAREVLTALTRGEPTAPGDLLPTCRLASGDAELYGEEEIAARFRRLPLDLAAADWAQSGDALAAVGVDHAIFADLAGGRIARLWHVGGACGEAPAPSFPVAFDPDMAQSPLMVSLDPVDFPDLSARTLASMMVAGMEVVFGTAQSPSAERRTRSIALKGLVTGDAVVALFAVVGGWRDGGRPHFAHALTVTPRTGGAVHVVRDPTPLQTSKATNV